MASDIDNASVTNDIRRFAQTMLIAAVDGTYQIGFVEAMYRSLITRDPGSNMRTLLKKLGKRFFKHWWKHVKQKDLMEVKIYDIIRKKKSQKVTRHMLEY